MKVLVTGATGFVGSRVVDLLLDGDQHEVIGLARNQERAKLLTAKGAEALVADLRSVDIIAEAAAKADAVLHLGFIHEFDKVQEALPTELRLLRAILSALEGSDKPFIITTGTILMADSDELADESFAIDPLDPILARDQAEVLMAEGSKMGVRTTSIRLAPYVYSDDGAAFSKIQEGKAMERGVSAYVNAGNNVLANLHFRDAAQLYIQALHHAQAGAIYNAAGGLATNRQIAEAIAEKHGLKAQSISTEAASEIYGPFIAKVFARRNRPDCSKAKTELHWQPKYDGTDFLQCVAGKMGNQKASVLPPGWA